MAESSLTARREDIVRYAAREVGIEEQSINTKDQQFLTDIVDSAIRQVYQPEPLPGEGQSHVWSWLRPEHEIKTVENYATGTIVVASGVVTGTGTTFPSWAAQGEIRPTTSGGQYSVNTRDSDTQLTLEDTTLSIGTDEAFTLRREYYDLPDDFAGIIGNELTFHETDDAWFSVPVIGESEMRKLLQRDLGDITGRPQKAAIMAPRIDRATYSIGSTTSVRDRLVIWPDAAGVYTMTLRMISTHETMTGQFPYVLGGAYMSEAVILSARDMARQLVDNDFSLHEMFLRRLWSAVMFDRKSKTPQNFGYNGDDSDVQGEKRRYYNAVTYEGAAYES